MNRRRFLETGALALGTAAIAPAKNADAAPLPAPTKQMKVGHQHYSTDADLRVLSALGVRNICSSLPSRSLDDNWTVESLTRLRERVEGFGVRLEMVPLPLSSVTISKSEMPAIMLGKSPDRDRAIDQICQMIQNAARAGIPSVKYNLTILGVVRTESTPGRGGATYSTFDYEKTGTRRDVQTPAGDYALNPSLRETLTPAGKVSADQMWERITYFLERVVPVAESSKVRICLHPHDPGMPPGTPFQGVHRVLGSVEGLKRFIEIKPSAYHGLNFCQGTISEMLQKPGVEIYEVIRYFGSRKKIFNVHFRNIKGGFLNFQETFPDDGDVDMLRALRAYKSVGYDGMIMPDHVPTITGDTGHAQAFAFAFGYIQALLQTVNREA